jgi:hypothetical protein
MMISCDPERDRPVTPDDPAEMIPADQRQVIFRAVVEAQDGGMTVEASRADAVDRFGVTADQVKAIEREGLDNQWPPL